jgi:hypothetical protein
VAPTVISFFVKVPAAGLIGHLDVI